MSKHRYAARIDNNQKKIVELLRQIPGISVQPGHDDVLVGYRGKTYWYEIKSPDVLSKRTGDVIKSAIKKSQTKLRNEWKGHYKIVSSFDEILQELSEL